jgi:pyruvate formate lyase activating enzyme
MKGRTVKKQKLFSSIVSSDALKNGIRDIGKGQKVMESGLVMNIQKYSIHDGPGIRTTVFLKGCPLRCWWCHNPEGLSSQPEIVVFENRCLACGSCRRVCPTGAAARAVNEVEDSNIFCTLCGSCIAVCPSGARQIIGSYMTVAGVVAEIMKDRLFYDDSGGGVTFSGGEPLAQLHFLKDLLMACRARGVHTAVDTCGYAPREHLLSVVYLTDLFLYDLKIINDAKHRQYTAVSNVPILENLKVLGDIHNNIWIRMPIIPGVNDDDENLEAVAKFITSIPGVRQVNLLPYHKTGIIKFKRLQQRYLLENIPEPSPQDMEKIRQKFSTFGVIARMGG